MHFFIISLDFIDLFKSFIEEWLSFFNKSSTNGVLFSFFSLRGKNFLALFDIFQLGFLMFFFK